MSTTEALAPAAEVDRLREQLADYEQRLRTLVDRNADGMVIVDEEGVVRFANAAAAALFAKRPDDLVGHHFGFPLVTRELTEIDVLASGASPAVAEMRVAEITWQNRNAFIASLRDITERLRSEELLRQKEEQLRRAQRLEAVGRCAAEMAHTMSDVLMGVAGCSRVALLELSPTTKAHELVGEILKATDDGTALVRRMARIAARRSPEAQPIDLNAAVMAATPLLRRLVGRALEITLDLGPALWPVHADPGLIEQVLVNLLVTARDALPGAGDAHVRTRNVTLGPAEEPFRDPVEPGEYVLLEVTRSSDVGAAMARGFEPLFTSRREPVADPGFAAVRAIVEESGGQLKIFGELGRGASFLVYLPRMRERASRSADDRGAPEPREGGETVLVVDDERLIRLALRSALDLAGYETLEAAGPAEALDLAKRREGPIHALIADVRMPGRSGLELGRELATLHPGLRVVYMADREDCAAIQDRVMAEDATLLEKPFGPELALSALEVALGPAASPPARESVAPAVGRAVTILLVEDDNTARNALATLLGYRGHFVLTARNAEEALVIARERGPAIDVLVSDLALGSAGANGDELARHVMGLAPEVHVIFLSGFPLELAQQRFHIPAGAEFMEKPVDLEKLELRIDTIRDAR